MKAVISNFTYKSVICTKSLPALLFFLIFFTSCKVFTTSRPINIPESETLLRDSIAMTAHEFIGIRYRYAGNSPDRGFDCSGFVKYIFAKYGFDLPNGSASQIMLGKEIDLKNTLPGDLVFFKRKGRVDHVALVVENNGNELVVIHSTSSRGVIREDILSSNYWNEKIYRAKNIISN